MTAVFSGLDPIAQIIFFTCLGLAAILTASSKLVTAIKGGRKDDE